MPIVTFVPADFRQLYPEFVNPPWTDLRLQSKFDMSTILLDNEYASCYLNVPQLTSMLYLMTAHLCALADQMAANGGSTGGIVTSARVGDVSVTTAAPPARDQWSWWLNGSPYGAELLALFSVLSAGGWSAGSLPEATAIRKYAGVFL